MHLFLLGLCFGLSLTFGLKGSHRELAWSWGQPVHPLVRLSRIVTGILDLRFTSAIRFTSDNFRKLSFILLGGWWPNVPFPSSQKKIYIYISIYIIYNIHFLELYNEYINIYIYGTPPKTHTFSEFTGICAILLLFTMFKCLFFFGVYFIFSKSCVES